jgi:hypothetical protein
MIHGIWMRRLIRYAIMQTMTQIPPCTSHAETVYDHPHHEQDTIK